MNERIQQLAEQAGFITTPNTDVIKNNHWGGYMDGRQFEKFAELIVQECSYRCYLIGEYQMAHELSDLYGFKFDFKKMMEEDDE